MKITQKIVNKIEGEANLKIYGEDIVDFVEIEFWQYRGIENYLVGRHYMDALVINPRICGICGHSHLLASAKVIEQAFGLEVSKKAEILRDITVGLEIIQNHLKWFYVTLFPTRIKDRKFMFKGLDIAREASKIIALIAGQFPHNSYIVPGGVTCDLTNLEVFKIKDMLKHLKENIEKNVVDENGKSEDLETFFEDLPKEIGKSLGRFLVLGNNLYFETNGDITKIDEEKNSSLSKNVFYKNRLVEVGSLARNLFNEKVREKYEIYSDSIYTRVFSRIYEVYLVIDYLLKIVNDIDVLEPSYIKYNKKSGKGKIAIEAPRGSLIHEIEIDDEVIRKYNIIVPTQFNLSSSSKENPSAAQAAMMGEKTEYIDTIFKCFDICAVCVSH
ncbi:nickel-dependent hydrogenase large subunit [Caminibacter pacificus]|uniref:Coenzyme F420-reducing hydrogenase alpha subunit n=1 Tax=Caminibacter pacificus TaxID=1424653 RepID=A0AAJ4UYD5_9BACT|nr:nickel-dependent hydrogenase large subunit [Caminibacter pacificus]NPA88104.1 cytochrome B [Campylobacterota bacterium]QCI28647.1 cytochrome B [Caminibacter pacificus]ROR40624.1 coenzyme F420-reducing hydrogenase alpha subunit [Caminibacter pacificus]